MTERFVIYYTVRDGKATSRRMGILEYNCMLVALEVTSGLLGYVIAIALS